MKILFITTIFVFSLACILFSKDIRPFAEYDKVEYLIISTSYPEIKIEILKNLPEGVTPIIIGTQSNLDSFNNIYKNELSRFPKI